MNTVRARGERIRRFILENVEAHPHDIAGVAAAKFGISRQAVNKHIARLVSEEALVRFGRTRNLRYKLRPQKVWKQSYTISGELAEDVVWRDDVAPALGALPENVSAIWNYGFTEMMNNAIDHSEGTTVNLGVEQTAISTEMTMSDDGIGIFAKIRRELGLLDERHAVLELSKGKLTTDPQNHTGEGIFFTSRMFDDFAILSGETFFSHKFEEREDWILEHDKSRRGTSVFMTLNNHTSRTLTKVFNKYVSEDDLRFEKTVVPVRLARYGNENLISRSQAKRLLARVDRFRTVILDFQDIEMIGQAFADEVFRVFPSKHPEVELVHIKANKPVRQMIQRAQQNEK